MLLHLCLSEKRVSLEMYPLPAITGEGLSLRCLAWGTDEISSAVFYKDNTTIHTGSSPIYNIAKVTESGKGSYKCFATFTYKARTAGPPYKEVSDDQYISVQGMLFCCLSLQISVRHWMIKTSIFLQRASFLTNCSCFSASYQAGSIKHCRLSLVLLMSNLFQWYLLSLVQQEW